MLPCHRRAIAVIITLAASYAGAAPAGVTPTPVASGDVAASVSAATGIDWAVVEESAARDQVMYLARPYPGPPAEPREKSANPSLAADRAERIAIAESVAVDFLLTPGAGSGVASAGDLLLDHTHIYEYPPEHAERGFDASVKYRQSIGGVPVIGSFHLVVMTGHGDVYIAKNNSYPDLSALTEPVVSAEQAVALAQGHYGVDISPMRQPKLWVYPQDEEAGLLVWELQFEAPVSKQVLVDAIDGSIFREQQNYVENYRLQGYVRNEYPGGDNLGIKGAWVRVYDILGTNYENIYAPEDGSYDTGYTLPEGAWVYFETKLDGSKVRIEDGAHWNDVVFMKNGPYSVPSGTGDWWVNHYFDDDSSEDGLDTREGGQCMRELQRGYEYGWVHGYQNPNKVTSEIRSDEGPNCYGTKVNYPNNRAKLDGGAPDDTASIDDTMVHEYTHAIHYAGLGGEFSWLNCEGHVGSGACGGDCTTADCANHGGTSNHCTCDSLSEGLANFFPVALYHGYNDSDTSYGWSNSSTMHDLESNTFSGNLGDNDGGAKEEACVASALWDIYDDANDTGDTLSQGVSEILHVITSVDPYTVEEFYNDFLATYPGFAQQVQDIFRAHGMEFDCNLRPYKPSGWDAEIVPRDGTGATWDSCHVTATLPGNSSSTYLNWAMINDGPYTAPNSTEHVFIDDVQVATGWPPVRGSGGAAWVGNLGTFNVRGGRHTLRMVEDAPGDVEESNESDNWVAKQYSWTPKTLYEDVPIQRDTPPKRDTIGYSYYNCDGFKGTMASNRYWIAFGTLPMTATANYDIRLHPEDTSPTTGFGISLAHSSQASGLSDYVIANRNIAGGTYTYYAGALNMDDDTVDFKVEMDTSGDVIYVGGVSGTETASQFIGNSDVLDMHEVYLGLTGLTRFKLNCTSGSADLGIAIYSNTDADGYYRKEGWYAHADAFTGFHYEATTFSVPSTGYYGVVVYKHGSDDAGKLAYYTLQIGQDLDAPTPSPMTFSLDPMELDTSSVTMWATTASDATSPPVGYYFEFGGSPTGGSGGSTSGWQSAIDFTDTALSQNHQYGYRVKARDSSALHNETAYSSVLYAYTDIETPTGITFGGVTDSSIQARSTNTPPLLSAGSSGLRVDNTTNGATSGWKQDNNLWTSIGLSPNKLYGFRAKARNRVADETPYCGIYTKRTLARQPGVAAFGTIGLDSIRCNWAANGNPTGTQYRGYCSTTTTHSGWSTSTGWTHTGLSPNSAYAFYAQARNDDLVTTSYTYLGTRYTLANPPVSMTHNAGSQTTTSMRWEWGSGGGQKDYYAWTTVPADNSGWTTNAYWNQSGLSPNTAYTAYAKARNGDDVETSSTSHTAYTSIQAPSAVAFGAYTSSSIAARSSSTPSNLTSGSSGTIVRNVTEGTNSGWRQNNNWWTSGGLAINTAYTFQTQHRNGDADLTTSASATLFTLAVAPGAPVTGLATSSAMVVSLDRGANPTHTQMALYNSTDGYYVDAGGGDNGATPVWQTESAWGTVTVTGLVADTDYDFVARARNGNGTETGWSGVGSGHTRKLRAYVDGTPPAESKGTGDSWLDPFTSIQAGVDAADEVWVAAGTYTENVTLREGTRLYGGFSGVEAERDERDWVANVTAISPPSGNAVEGEDIGDGVVSGFTITAVGTGVAVVVHDDSYPVISENVITGYAGIFADYAWPAVANNLIRDCGAYGYLSAYPEPHRGRFVNNTVVGSQYSGVYILGDADIINNIVVGNNVAGSGGHGGIRIEDEFDPAIACNDVWGNQVANYVAMPDLTGTDGNISEDPEFAGPMDYHLTEDSPCIDAGVDFALPSIDWEGEPRVLDGDGDGTPVVDIGADEYYGAILVSTPPGWLTLGWNLISIPNEPLDPAGEAVFAGIVPPNYLETNLFKYIPVQGYKEYGIDFTEMETCVGYWLRLTSGGECTYEAWPVKDEVRIPMVLGWNLIGVPGNEDVLAAEVLVTDGVDTYSLGDVAGHGWMQVPLYYYTNVSGYLEMGPAGPDDDHFRRWYGYWVLTWVPGLELIILAP